MGVHFPNESFFQFTFVHEQRRACCELLLKTLLGILRDGDMTLAQDLACFLCLPPPCLAFTRAKEKQPDKTESTEHELVSTSDSFGLPVMWNRLKNSLGI